MNTPKYHPKTRIVLTYAIQHEWNVHDLLREYQKLVQRAIDEIWDNTFWKEKNVKHRKATRLIPYFPKSNEFKRKLRNKLLDGWHFAKHYVDSAMKTAYSILKSRRQNYMRGKRRKKKHVVKRKFVRV